MTEIDEVLHRLGKAFVAGLHEPGYELTTVKPHSRQSQTYTMAGEPARLGSLVSSPSKLAVSRSGGLR